MDKVNDILSKLGALASSPQAMLRVTAMLGDGSASAANIESVARQDEALSVAILRSANSAAYGVPGRVFTLRESIGRLGSQKLLRLVMQQRASAVFARAGAGYALERGALWRGALGGAIAAEILARRAAFGAPDLAYLCALLRDIGKLAFDAHFGVEYQNIVRPHVRPDRTHTEAERAAFGFDHAELGAELAKRWGLPERICRCIHLHHAPPSDPPDHDSLFDIVHASDIVGLWAGLAIGCDGLQYRLAEHVRLGLGLDRQTVENTIASVWDALRAAEAPPQNHNPERACA